MDFTYARREGGDATDKTGCLRGGRKGLKASWNGEKRRNERRL